MSGLRPFRTIPTDINEWTRWMKAQENFGSVASSTTTTTNVDGSTTTTVVNAATSWEFYEFSTHYTLRVDDAGKFGVSTGGSATNVTLDPGVFEVGDQVCIYQEGAGAVTIVAGSGTTIHTPSTLVFNEQYGTVTLIQYDNDEWFIAGRMSA